MSRISLIVVLLIAIAGCASAPGIADPNAPAATARVELLNVSPAAGSELTSRTKLVAELRYTIENFKPGVDYSAAALFASNDQPGMTFNMLDRFLDAHRISSAQGTITVRQDVARELSSPKLARPIRVWFYIMERTGPTSTRVIGMTEAVEYGER